MALRVTSVLLVPVTLLVWCQPGFVHARTQPPGEVATDAPPDDDAIDDPEVEVEEAKRMFAEGANKFETADYAGAIDLWTQAYGLVPSVPENSVIKAKLIANLAAAHQRAYAVDNLVEHLNQAKILLESYLSSFDDIYMQADALEREREQAWVADRLSKIEAELQVVADREEAERQAEADRNAEPKRVRPPGRALIIGGSVLTSVGVAGLGVMVGGMVIGAQNNDISDLPTNELETRKDRFARGRLGNTLAIAGGVGGAVLLGAGVALLVVGLNKKRAAGSEAAPEVALVPTFDPTQVGVSLVGRF